MTKTTVSLETDASLKVWGGHVVGKDLTAQGVWSVEESRLHINVLEMRAVLKCLKRFQRVVSGRCVELKTDNSTVVRCIGKIDIGKNIAKKYSPEVTFCPGKVTSETMRRRERHGEAL